MPLLEWFDRPKSIYTKLVIVVLSIPVVIGLVTGAAYLATRLIAVIQRAFASLADSIAWSPPTSQEGLIRTCLGLVAVILIVKFLFGGRGGGRR